MRFWDGQIQEFTLLEFLGFETKNFDKKKHDLDKDEKKTHVSKVKKPLCHFGQVDFNMSKMTKVEGKDHLTNHFDSQIVDHFYMKFSNSQPQHN
jgi:hypothetical protein